MTSQYFSKQFYLFIITIIITIIDLNASFNNNDNQRVLIISQLFNQNYHANENNKASVYGNGMDSWWSPLPVSWLKVFT